MCGIGPRHIRFLCESPWEGGFGYTPTQVGELTLDQIYLLLCEKQNLRSSSKKRMKKAKSLEVAAQAEGGLIKGRAGDGTPIKGRITGKSLASRLAEQQQKEGLDKLRQSRKG